MAFFTKECLDPVTDRVIVCEPHENSLISNAEDKGDVADSDKLSRLLRLGAYREVHIPKRCRLEIRELMQAYEKITRDVVRHKNRIHDKYRRYAVRNLNASIYDKDDRDDWLKKIRRGNAKLILATYYQELDSTIEAQACLHKKLQSILRCTREYRILCTIPGIGPILAAIMIGIIDTPFRFKTKRKLWAYAGLSVRRSQSGKQKKAKTGGSRRGNRLLKYAAMTAAKHAIRGDNAFARHSAQMLSQGVSFAMAQKTIARKILATVWSMWRTRSVYRDDILVAKNA
jgi:transposase